MMKRSTKKYEEFIADCTARMQRMSGSSELGRSGPPLRPKTGPQKHGVPWHPPRYATLRLSPTEAGSYLNRSISAL